MSATSERGTNLLATVLLIGALGPLLRACLLVPVRVPLDVNEGWIAMHVTALVNGDGLYAARDALFVNNYPPLFFHLLACGVSMGLDPIAVGRALSLGALAACAVLVYRIAGDLGASPGASRAGAALLVAVFTLYTHYVGVCDPQLLAHAVSLAGIALAVRPGRTWRHVAASGALCALALLVKHTLVALPLCVGVWLLVNERRLAAWWWGAGAFTALAMTALCLGAYGPEFVTSLSSPRQLVPGDALFSLGRWSAKLSPLLVGVWLGARTADGAARRCAVCVAVALGVGVAAQSGAGVDSNALFECFIAVAVGVAVSLSALRGRALVAAQLLCVLPFAWGVVRHARAEWAESGWWLRPKAREAALTEQEIAFIASRPGPALCSEIALGFWAGKRGCVDPFNLGQQVACGTRSWADVHAGLQRCDARVVQISDGSSRFLGADVTLWGFRRHHDGIYGAVFVR